MCLLDPQGLAKGPALPPSCPGLPSPSRRMDSRGSSRAFQVPGLTWPLGCAAALTQHCQGWLHGANRENDPSQAWATC